MTNIVRLTTLLWIAASTIAVAAESFPKADWADQPNPLASANAETGGELIVYPGPYPQSFNYYLDNNVFSSELFSFMYETLLSLHPVTVEHEPALAERWSIGDDLRTFTFWIDPRARWSDGQPITAADVKWTFDAIMNPKNLTGVHKVSLEKFNPPVVVDTHLIRFEARETHWRNLMALGGFHILPKHAFEALDFNKINFEFPVISGSYRLAELKEAISVTMERRSDWWQAGFQRNRGTGNFSRIRFKFFEERENAFEAFKKGEIDLFPVYTARVWANETSGEKFDRNWIVKQRVFNYDPIGFQGFAMNMRRAPFDDLRVRQAMAYLLDRKKMNSTLMYDQYFLHRSYYEDLYTVDQPCKNEAIEFNEEQARRLLAEAGWVANDKTGILEKDGRPFRFKFLNRDNSTEKFLSIYAEDLKDVGIQMEIDKKDWTAWSKDMDEFNYDMTWAAWGAGLFKDPEGMWASSEAERRAGNNITGFRDPKVDALIEQQKSVFDITRRNEILREVDAIVYSQFPYVLLWNINYTRLLYWNKFGMPATVLSKYGGEQSAYAYWWYDADSAADLKDAMERGLPLPKRPESVYFERRKIAEPAAPVSAMVQSSVAHEQKADIPKQTRIPILVFAGVTIFVCILGAIFAKISYKRKQSRAHR